jgi:RNA polymerase sigma-70 factor (ECF subfamily)
VLSHQDRLLRLARTRVGDDAEDIVQEALLRCATFADLDEARLGPLLTSVTVRLCVDEHRRRTRATHLARRLPVEPPEPGVDEPVCARAEAAWAAEVVRALPAMQQAVLADRAEGMSYDEIARRHRVTYKSAESAASRARAFVREAIATTLTLVAFARRQTSAPAAVVTAGAAVALGVLAAPPAVRVDPMTAAPGRAPYVAAPRAVGQPGARRPGATAGAARPHPVRTPTGTAAQHETPSRRPDPIVKIGDGSVGNDEHQQEYTTEQRVQHCVQYGVELSPTIRCRYPEGTR